MIKFYRCFKREQKTYLDQKYHQEVEVGNSPELLKKIFWDEVPKSVLWEREKAKETVQTQLKTTANT